MRKIIWFSCGAASAVTAKLAVNKDPNTEVVYCDTGSEHPDNKRFLKDVEKWIGKKVTVLKSDKYADIWEVFSKTGWLVGVSGARCTTELKRKLREGYQKPDDVHMFGFTSEEEDRASRFEYSYPELKTEWPLIERGLSKKDCLKIIAGVGISIPAMYSLQYKNNNCIGCPKGSQGYWNKIRIDFPDVFTRMAKVERKLNVAINKSYAGDGKRKRVFLDELDPVAGNYKAENSVSCGLLCQEVVEKLTTEGQNEKV